MTTNLSPLPVGSTVGILGGGQLGKMLAAAAAQLGYKPLIYCPEKDACALTVARGFVAGWEDGDALKFFAEQCGVITCELDEGPGFLWATKFLEGLGKKVFPGTEALLAAQDRRRGKEIAFSAGIKNPWYGVVTKASDFSHFADCSFPMLLKTCTGGYDGKGQRKVNSVEELEPAFAELGSVDCVLEKIVDFFFEFSVIVVRGQTGECRAYAPFRNFHENGILVETVWPERSIFVESVVASAALDSAKRIADRLEVVGLVAVEFFYARDGKILFNEFAVRPHNSGHVTLDWAYTSQFEQHIRAVCGLPFGSTAVRGQGGKMVNVIGNLEQVQASLPHPKARIYIYGKPARPGRKLGHINRPLMN
ncbi:MAG: 5-(carboxyamino)imidazole ribonucleotide synthase [Patescibacteria group bacterium]